MSEPEISESNNQQIDPASGNANLSQVPQSPPVPQPPQNTETQQSNHIFSSLILFGLLPLVLGGLRMMLFLPALPVLYMVFLALTIVFYFFVSLNKQKQSGLFNPYIVISTLLISSFISFLGFSLICAISMLIPCDQSELFEPRAISMMIDLQLAALLSYFLSGIFLKNNQTRQINLKVPMLIMKIIVVSVVIILIVPFFRNKLFNVIQKQLIGYQRISVSNSTKNSDQTKLTFKQSLEAALAHGLEYDSNIGLEQVQLAVGGEEELVKLGMGKIVPEEDKDFIVYGSSDVNTVTIIIDGDTGQIKDSYMIKMHGSGGFEEFSDLNYGPLEALNAAMSTPEYREFYEGESTNHTKMARLGLWDKPYDWKIRFGKEVNGVYSSLEFEILAKDLSINNIEWYPPKDEVEDFR